MLNKKITFETNAIEEFRSARLQANLERIRAALTGKSADLLSYDDLRENIRAIETNQRILKDIPLDAIIGSVGRYQGFTRKFFPLHDTSEPRWASVRQQVESMEGLPPIEAYQVGEVYFVIDGNHRVSVARSLGAESIEGYVTPVQTNIPFTADVDLDEYIVAERYANFLELSKIQEKFPDANFKMSAAGNYRILERQIYLHQELMGKNIIFEEAAADWYKTVYCPIIQIIRRQGMMRDFPHRTETDLYVWIEKYRHDLADNLGWMLESEIAAADLVEKHSQQPKNILHRASHKLMDAVIPDALEAGPMPGEWRTKWLEIHQDQHLFRFILVAINGHTDGWNALDHALSFAQRENGQIFGLHIIDDETNEESLHLKGIRRVFEQRCHRAEVPAELSIQTGNIQHEICDNARWMDLVVVSLAHPPGPLPTDRLSSGFSQLLRRCPRPVLSVPQTSEKIERLLLAYDDSSTSREAMFIAAYMAKQWEIPIAIVSVKEDGEATEALAHAKQYFEKKNIPAVFIDKEGEAASEILDTASEQKSDLIVMGSYGHSPVLEIALGSTVDKILREFRGSVFVCR